MCRVLLTLLCCVSALLCVCLAAERIKVLFTPTVCRLRCTADRCTNYCERGNISTIFSNEEHTQTHTQTSGFRVFVCPLLCKNGGMCVQKDRCLCPPKFTGKFCHIPVSSSSSEMEKSSSSAEALPDQGLMKSEYILPLQNLQLNHTHGSPMVTVRVHHPPEASVKVHQVLKVTSGSNSETITRSSGLPGSRGHSTHRDVLLNDRAEAPPPRVLAQTIRGDVAYTEASGFKYCFREVRDGQCSSPMPGLRSQDACCKADGVGWGLNDCTLCPSGSGSSGSLERSCPKGFERVNGNQCVDINECLLPGFCENGKCVNTRGSYSCACNPGFLLDASQGICISQKVISEEKDQCFRIVSQGSCSLPILKNITKQICCCSRVGKAWGSRCEACPHFGLAQFKEICPAGPGYHYSPNTLRLQQRVAEPNTSLGSETNHTVSVVRTSETSVSTRQYETPKNQTRTGAQPTTVRQNVQTQHPTTPGQNSDLLILQNKPQPSQNRKSGSTDASTNQPIIEQSPVIRTQTSGPSINRHPVTPIRPVPVTQHTPSSRPQDKRVCEAEPQVCGPGRCVDVPGGKHTCVCNSGFILNSIAGRCQDLNECVLTPRQCVYGQCENTEGSFFCICAAGYQTNSQQSQCSEIDECRQIPNPCTNGRCENTLGSFRCVCRTGYKLQENTCTDVDECEDPLRCLGTECVNSQGSYRCVACKPGFGLLNGQCSDIDECRQRPSPCTNGRCENTPGSYKCVCNTGFKQLGNICTDVNECEDPLRCPGLNCLNTPGSYRCVSCGPGLTFISGRCSDIDECRQVPAPCANGRCENTPGSYRCVCRTGYRQQGNTCTDVDECENSLQCRGQVCVNTPGSYRCTACGTGFSFRNGQCSDVDECAQNSRLCANGHCENTPGSFRCVCRSGFRLEENTCTDVNECENELQCPEQKCVNSIGSFKCVSCDPGFQIRSGQCHDVDECSQTPPPCSSSQCRNTAGSYSCSCRSGFKQQGNTCTDVDECSQTPPPCSNGQCRNTAGSYSCSCRPGFKQQGNTCTDVDECSQTPPPCSSGQCRNTAGSYSCSCRPGFKQQGNTCTDVDECSQTPPLCSNGQCRNTPGSYSCSCRPGFKQQGNTCTDVDECSQTPPFCSNGQCRNTPGSYSCSCRPGFKQQGNTCRDLNECESPGLCGLKNVCVNTEGSYRCECSPGYRATGPGHQCRDINECLEGEFCFTGGECLNTEGSYMCVCAQGYQTDANSTKCIDIDECVKDGVCENGVCTNTAGSFTCHCRTGFTTNPEKSVCLDVDECVDSEGSVCEFQRCENTIGSYRCVVTCEPGYSLSPTGECVDINECANETVCGKHTCLNLIGTYQCVCDQGYEIGSAGKCVDVNECVTITGVCGSARCKNVEGSFTCECENRQEEYNPITRQCVNPASASSGPPRPGEKRDCYSSVGERDQCSVLSLNTSLQECCCTVGRAWGLKCKYTLCPQPETPDFNAMCPSGRGYVYNVYSGHTFPSTAGGFSYRDVDECKLFDPELCKGGVCVNTIPGYACYCPNGYYYDQTLLQCIDNNECDSGGVCLGGGCVNTLGSYYCTCEPPLVLDDTQQYCINSSALTVEENRSYCWGHVTADLMCQNFLQGVHLTYVECCCSIGEAWGLQCALCPRRDEAAYEAMCTAIGPPPESPRYAERFPPVPETGGGYSPPYSAPVYPDFSLPDYTDYSTGTRSRSGLRTQSSSSYTPYVPPALSSSSYYGEEDYDSAPQPPFSPERSYSSRFSPSSISTGDEEEEGAWRVPAPFPPFPARRTGSERSRRVYDGRYESYAGLAEGECGILQGCENGRCVRVGEGYTCDCYEGYQLDVTTMTCIDIDECEDLGYPECINARCVNTGGSYRCVCFRGFIMSRRSNYCIPA